MASDKIYIFEDGDELWYKSEEWDTPPPHRIEYIRKGALLDKLNLALKLRTDGNPDINTDGVQTIRAMINYIESL